MARHDTVTVNETLISQFGVVLDQLRETIEGIPADEWVRGDSGRHTPVRQAVHIIGGFEAYAKRSAGGHFRWGDRWGYKVGAFRAAIPVEELPDQPAVIEYLEQVRTQVDRWLGGIPVDRLCRPRHVASGRFHSYLGRILYLLRHGVLHLGYLNEELRRRGIAYTEFR
ncbi:MAG: hypothetical protein AMK72_12685 [Planctomycetes bacterium SM23_25]|nr:MAG: hypothetical protein AMK72_12685 [Planctomycetes bacterium SM23_25]